ncbi:radical SAM protein [Clostridium sp. KNHs205]|uniref:radical SAM/SPASM domain-containing protein n=1 Tax=Clostridium sp. KNHs205 TaxID=1449050 RepID=UPI00051AFE2E|nr:radical SAM protein [Clostridium sp. KNHs205]
MDSENQISSLNSLTYEKGLPYSASIELITKCNFKCIHCYIAEHNKEMKAADVIKILDELKALGVLDLTLTGGEIFLLKDIMNIIEYARKIGFRVTLFTNLSLMNEEIIKKLSELYITEISTTVFSLDSEINDKITCIKDSLNNIIKNILLIKQYNIQLEIKVPIMDYNYNSYIEIKDFCNENGFRFNYSTAITSKINGDTKTRKFNISGTDLNKIIKDLDNVTSNKFKSDDYICGAVRNNIHIDCFGNVYPCISLLYKYGNIFNDTLVSIWNNSKQKKYLNSLRKKDFLLCTNCNINDKCVKCPGMALSEDGDLFGCSSLDQCLAIARQNILEL